jgi:RNA polymerase sigma factor (sigma-70 family)
MARSFRHVLRVEAIEPGLAQVTRRTDVDLDSAFTSSRPRLVRIAASLVGADAAEDVVHDAYLMARERIGQLRDPGAIEAWLARICVHRAFRLRRRGKRLHELLDALPFPRVTPPPHGSLELHELVERLAPRERAVVVLQHGYGYSLEEVARLVGVSHANARKISSRTRARLLREWLEADA